MGGLILCVATQMWYLLCSVYVYILCMQIAAIARCILMYLYILVLSSCLTNMDNGCNQGSQFQYWIQIPVPC